MKTKKTLPRKLSDLIEVALDDLREVERLPKVYSVDMAHWHKANSHCSVCFAGAVMARTLGAHHKYTVLPDEFRATTAHKLFALNEARQGDFYLALYHVRGNTPVSDKARAQLQNFWKLMGMDAGIISMVLVPPYAQDRKGFHRVLRKSVRMLRRVGL